MYYAYIIRSIKFPSRVYKGFTERTPDVRLGEHNQGMVPSTKQFRPWALEFFAAFYTKVEALSFEKYLKTASGIAFMRKRLIRKIA